MRPSELYEMQRRARKKPNVVISGDRPFKITISFDKLEKRLEELKTKKELTSAEYGDGLRKTLAMVKAALYLFDEMVSVQKRLLIDPAARAIIDGIMAKVANRENILGWIASAEVRIAALLSNPSQKVIGKDAYSFLSTGVMHSRPIFATAESLIETYMEIANVLSGGMISAGIAITELLEWLGNVIAKAAKKVAKYGLIAFGIIGGGLLAISIFSGRSE